MASVCPTCNSSIDPARAPVARVRGTHVLTFCSAECADRPQPVESTGAAAPRAQRAPTAPGAVSAPVEASRGHEQATSAGFERAEGRSRRNRRSIVALLSAILVAGMIAAILDGVSPSRSTDASAAAGAVQHTEPAPAAESTPAPDPDEPVDIDPQRLLERARTELRSFLESPSPRLQRIAAMALARDGDEAALERLRTLADSESSELVKVQIAHVRARAGDEQGHRDLVGFLRSDRRDVRVDAARSLARLGDDRGVRVLRSLLSYRTYRMGAAAVLAGLGDERGLEFLRKRAGGGARSEEQRVRAVVALGRAGQEQVKDELVSILEDRTHRVGAAAALAELGADEAVPVLVEQLEHPSLRVRAAVALRGMDREVDLEPLALALVNGGEVARVSAAEAVLVLLGAEEAERD